MSATFDAGLPTVSDHAGIICISFSQDFSSFACGTQTGYQVFDCNPPRARFRRDPFEPRPGGIGLIELLFRSSIVALVGGGRQPRFPPSQVVIWDESRGLALAEIEVEAPVLAVRLAQGRLFVATEQRVDVFSLAGDGGEMLLRQFETGINPLGLMAVHAEPLRLVCPLPGAGSLYLGSNAGGDPAWPRSRSREDRLDGVCRSQLTCLALDAAGSLLATASEVGTLVRVWNCDTLRQTHEFRRGTSEATINSLVFSPDSRFLLVASQGKPTIHIFSLTPAVKNIGSRWSSLGGVFGWAQSEWACVSFSATSAAVRHCCFADMAHQHFSVIVVATDGTWYKQRFNIVADTVQPGPAEEYLFLQELPLSTLLTEF